jgi:hypothetical protein
MRLMKINLMGRKIIRSVKQNPGVSTGLVATGLTLAIVGGIMLAQKRKASLQGKTLQPAAG